MTKTTHLTDSELIGTGLRPLEENEKQITAPQNAIDEGLDSGIVEDFNPEKHLKSLKTACYTETVLS